MSSNRSACIVSHAASKNNKLESSRIRSRWSSIWIKPTTCTTVHFAWRTNQIYSQIWNYTLGMTCVCTKIPILLVNSVISRGFMTMTRYTSIIRRSIFTARCVRRWAKRRRTQRQARLSTKCTGISMTTGTTAAKSTTSAKELTQTASILCSLTLPNSLSIILAYTTNKLKCSLISSTLRMRMTWERIEKGERNTGENRANYRTATITMARKIINLSNLRSQNSLIPPSKLNQEACKKKLHKQSINSWPPPSRRNYPQTNPNIKKISLL